MKYYRVNSDFPYLVATQAEAKRDARACKCSYETVDIPTDKEGLMAYLNGLEHNSAPDKALQPEPPKSKPDDPEEDLDADGFPKARSAFTLTQIAAATLPRSPQVQDVCHAIAKMRANELGYVALEVLARGARLGGMA